MGSVWAICYNSHAPFLQLQERFQKCWMIFCPDNIAIIKIWKNKSVIQCIHCLF